MEKKLTAHIHMEIDPQTYTFHTLDFETAKYSRNMSLYLGYCSESEAANRKSVILKEVDAYNAAVQQLTDIDGFIRSFIEHDCSYSHEDIENDFGEKVKAIVCSIEGPCNIYPQLVNRCGTLMDTEVTVSGEICIDGENITFGIDGDADHYPSQIGKSLCFWDWSKRHNDTGLYLYKDLENKIRFSDKESCALECYDYYDQTRDVECDCWYCQELCANLSASLLKLVRRRPNRPVACSAWMPNCGPSAARQGWRSHLRSP